MNEKEKDIEKLTIEIVKRCGMRLCDYISYIYDDLEDELSNTPYTMEEFYNFLFTNQNTHKLKQNNNWNDVKQMVFKYLRQSVWSSVSNQKEEEENEDFDYGGEDLVKDGYLEFDC